MTDRRTRDVFVIMPFNATPTRDKSDLTAFFENNLKEPIETHEGFEHRYRVLRSDDSFDIGKKIVRDIYTADIVLCDLSGEHANPNVMYELGLRLALTNKPVIMFRESHPTNKRIFDISVYHTHEYAVTRYKELERYILAKIRKFENGEEQFVSPVLEILAKEPSVVEELQISNARAQQEAFVTSISGILRALGGSFDFFLTTTDSQLRVPQDSGKLLEFLMENKEQLQKIDIARFKFRPNTPPSLHSYLASLPLRRIVPQWLSMLLNSVLAEYYDTFFGSDFYWTNITIQKIQSFVAESFVVRNAIRRLLMYFAQETDAERDQELHKMLDCLTHFLDWGKDTIEPLRVNIATPRSTVANDE